MIEKTKVIAVLKDIENPPVWPPSFNGEQIFSIECDDSVNIGMYYDAETGLFSNEKTDEIDKNIEKIIKKSYDYYDGYVAGKILMNHADIHGDEMISKAMAMKPVIETLAASLEDNEALKIPELFPEWFSVMLIKQIIGYIFQAFSTNASKTMFRNPIGHLIFLHLFGCVWTILRKNGRSGGSRQV